MQLFNFYMIASSIWTLLFDSVMQLYILDFFIFTINNTIVLYNAIGHYIFFILSSSCIFTCSWISLWYQNECPSISMNLLFCSKTMTQFFRALHTWFYLKTPIYSIQNFLCMLMSVALSPKIQVSPCSYWQGSKGKNEKLQFITFDYFPTCCHDHLRFPPAAGEFACP